MSKRKWYTRALYTIVALAMTVGLLMVPAAVAAPPDSEGAASPAVAEVVFTETGKGEACWSNCQAYTTGNWSVKLDTGAAPTDGVESAKVVLTPPAGITLDDMALITSGWSWWYYVDSSTTPVRGTKMELIFRGPGCGYAEMVIMDHAYGAGVAGPLETDKWVEQDVTKTTTGLVFGTEEDGTGIAQFPVSGQPEEPVADMVAYMIAAEGTGDAGDWILTEVRPHVSWTGNTQTIAYVDDVTIDGTLYEMEADEPLTLGPKTAYNVKTAKETFVVADQQGNPICPELVYVDEWFVTKGCGPGEVTIYEENKFGMLGSDIAAPDADDGADFITVRMVTMGDAIVTAIVLFDDDCDDETEPVELELSGEKKWGEIYCTKLEREDHCLDNKYVLTETVTALFWRHECTEEVQHVADDAKVDWWLMKIAAQAAIEALEAELGDDPCDVDGGCGAYPPGWLFQYDLDGDGTIQLDEKFATPRAALLAIYDQYKLSPTEDTTNYINAVDTTHVTTSSNELGITTVIVHTEAPTSVILATLTDYPIDKAGQNVVCVQHEKWVVTPPPFLEKLPNIVWAGEKDVIEWRLPEGAIGSYVIFYLEDPSVGTFEGTDPWFVEPTPYGVIAIKDTAITVVEENECDGSGVARVVLQSNKQGKANVVAALLEYGPEDSGQSSPKQIITDGVYEIVSQQGFLVFFLAFEDVELVNLPDDVNNDEAWEEAGEMTSELAVDDESLLRLRVKGYFEDPVLDSPRASKGQDTDGDGLTDIILPAGRWVLPDDYPILADGLLWQLNKPHWDVMDTPIDEIVSMLDLLSDKVATLGPYGDGACFESPLSNTALTTAQQLAAYLEGLVSCYPVIGPFSKLEPPTENGWELCDVTWNGTLLTFAPAVPADGKQVDALKVAGIPPILTFGCRTTVVPDGLLTPEDAVMPPAEILFVVTDGDGELTDVNKADLYYRDEDCTFGTLGVDGEVYTNPYYWQEIPANWMIPPMYGSGPAGYEWDSWDLGADNPEIDGPYRFWDSLTPLWASDLAFARTLAGLGPTDTPEVLKVYTDNRGEAWAEFEQKDFDSSEIKAVASYPYLIGDHPAVVSNKVTNLSKDEKNVKVAVETVDEIRDLLYVFVRNYDGTPATCEEVEWAVDGPYGTIEELYEGAEGTSCDNDCLDVTCIRDIAAGSRSADSCTRVMTPAEITKFTGAYINNEVVRLLADTGILLFDPAVDEDPADYAIAGIVVLSSLGEDVDILIKVHDCWRGDEEIITEDQVLYFGEPEMDNPAVAEGLDHCSAVVVMVYNFDNAAKTWSWYNPSWPAGENTLDTLYKGKAYWVKASANCTLLYGNQSYDLSTGWNNIPWLGY